MRKQSAISLTSDAPVLMDLLCSRGRQSALWRRRLAGEFWQSSGADSRGREGRGRMGSYSLAAARRQSGEQGDRHRRRRHEQTRRERAASERQPRVRRFVVPARHGAGRILRLLHAVQGFRPVVLSDRHVYSADEDRQRRLGRRPASRWPNASPPAMSTGIPVANVLEIQAINEFNRFDPMEVIATAEEMKKLLAAHAGKPYLLFPEDRRYPIRMTDELPQRWIQAGPSDAFQGKADRGEFYVFQIGVYATGQDLKNIRVSFTPLNVRNVRFPPRPCAASTRAGPTGSAGRSPRR